MNRRVLDPRNLRRNAVAFLSGLCLVLVWWILSCFYDEDTWPGPRAVFKIATNNLITGEFLSHFKYTFLRIVVGFLLSALLSLVVAVLMGKWKIARTFFEVQITFGLTVPALAWSIVAIILFGLRDIAAVFTIVAATTPLIATTIYEGIKNLDKDLLEVSTVYRLRKRDTLLLVIIPQLWPYFLASSRYGFAFAWKTVIITEMLGLTEGLGYQISYWFGMLSMKNVLAWILPFTLVMFAIELLVFKTIEKRLFKWKPSPSY